MASIQELQNRINANWKAINDAYSGGADYWDVAWMQEQINEDLAQIDKLKAQQVKEVQTQVDTQKAADEKLAADAKAKADYDAFIASVANAQKTTQQAREYPEEQMRQMDEMQKQKDLQKVSSITPPSMGSVVGFDITKANEAGVAKTGAFSSSAKRQPQPGYQQQPKPIQSNQMASGENKFQLPELKGIQLGGA